MDKLIKEINRNKNTEKAKILSRFFKTGKGEYGYGDVFLGLTVPVSRKIASRYNLPLSEIEDLLKNKIHEVRLIGLFILIKTYKSASEKDKEKIFKFYLRNTKHINNWDLVDTSAPYIVGDYLLNKKTARPHQSSGAGGNRDILYKLANSKNLWEERIAIISTFAFIRKNDFKETLDICKILLNHKHDLIHKACGWMLREVGKKDEAVLKRFLNENISKMPRTMLRYAIEKFTEKERIEYLKRK